MCSLHVPSVFIMASDVMYQHYLTWELVKGKRMQKGIGLWPEEGKIQ